MSFNSILRYLLSIQNYIRQNTFPKNSLNLFTITLAHDTAQESVMNALGSFLFHDVVNQT
jgi:hypothetical protein